MTVILKIMEIQPPHPTISYLISTQPQIPTWQRPIDKSHVQVLCEFQKKYIRKHRCIFNPHNIVLCLYNKVYWILDGQHRSEMWKVLCEQRIIPPDQTIKCVYYECKTEDEMIELYENLNNIKNYNPSLNDEGFVLSITPQTKNCLQYITDEMTSRFSRQISRAIRPSAPRFNIDIMQKIIREEGLHERYSGEVIMDELLAWNDEWGRTLPENKLNDCVDGFYLPCSINSKHASCKWVHFLAERLRLRS